MDNTRQIRVMVIVSLLIHVIVLGVVLTVYTFRSPAGSVSLPDEAPIVALYELADIETALQDVLPPSPPVQEEPLVALQDVGQVLPTMTPTPRPTRTPTPVPSPKVVVSTPKPKPTPTPEPTPTTAVAFEVPKRQGVLKPWPSQEAVQAALQTPLPQITPDPQPVPTEQQVSNTTGISQETTNEQSLNGIHPSGEQSSLMFEAEDEFPYPEYLAHIKEKIEGIWFPEGSGTVSIILIIDKNGKILKSGVDKHIGVDVNKLRDSVIRAVTLVKSFQPLPEEFSGTQLQVRITVRR